jgi:hypothetical protein
MRVAAERYFELSKGFDEIDLVLGQEQGHRGSVARRRGARIVDDRLNHVECMTNLTVDEITA